MTNIPRSSKKSKKFDSDGIPLIVLSLMGGGVLLGYLGAEIILYARTHPTHWAAALVIGMLSYLVGEMIYRRYGDIL